MKSMRSESVYKIMMHDFDPYQALQHLEHQAVEHASTISHLTQHVTEMSQLMENLAHQIRHMSRALAGLRDANMILHERLTRLEDGHD